MKEQQLLLLHMAVYQQVLSVHLAYAFFFMCYNMINKKTNWFEATYF